MWLDKYKDDFYYTRGDLKVRNVLLLKVSLLLLVPVVTYAWGKLNKYLLNLF